MQIDSREQATKGNRYFDTLVSLRGIFALGIILFHISDSFGRIANSFLRGVYDWGGHFGNCYFFILSGFLMVHAYRDKISSRSIGIKSFVKKRFLRIYPLYIVTNIFVLVYNSIINGFITYFKPRDMIEIFFMICSGWVDDIYPWNAPGWFVSMLMLCYLLYFFIAKFYSNADAYYLFVGAFIFIGYIFIIKKWDFPFCYSHDGEGIFSFFIGVALYDIFKELGNLNHAPKKILEILWGGAFLLFSAISFKYGFQEIVQEIYIVMAVLIMPVLIWGAIYWQLLAMMLRLTPIYLWGKISFSACMWHIPWICIFEFMRKKLTWIQSLNSGIQLMLYFLCLAIISSISYLLIENSGWKQIYIFRNLRNRMKIHGK